MGEADTRPTLLSRLLGRPVVTAVMIACTLGGAVAGAGCGLLVTFTKLAD